MDAYLVPPRRCGVYHLLDAGAVVYIGQSENVVSRVASWAGVVQFDSYRVFPCAVDELNDLEREHIARHKPPLNRAGNTRAFLPAPRYQWQPPLTREQIAARFDKGDELVAGGCVVYWTGAARRVEQLVALADAGLFPAPVASTNRTPYWRAGDVAAWVRESTGTPRCRGEAA